MILCANCGTPSVDNQESTVRKPCLNCGSKSRVFHEQLTETISTYSSWRTGHKDPSRKSKDKLRSDTFTGYEFSHSKQKMISKVRVIDKDHDYYFEEVVDPVTKEVLHTCDEKLSEHRGYGSAKKKLT